MLFDISQLLGYAYLRLRISAFYCQMLQSICYFVHHMKIGEKVLASDCLLADLHTASTSLKLRLFKNISLFCGTIFFVGARTNCEKVRRLKKCEIFLTEKKKMQSKCGKCSPFLSLYLRVTVYSAILFYTWSRSYQFLISTFLQFLLLSLSVYNIDKIAFTVKMTILMATKNRKYIHFTKKKVW